MKPESIIEQLLTEADSDRQQAIMNKAYDRWQPGGEHEGKDLATFTASLEEPERMAVVLGKLNQQVTNGGWLQWIDNGYGDAAWPYLREYLDQLAPQSENVRKLQAIVNGIADRMEDADAETLKDLIDSSGGDSLRDAIMNKEWDEVYTLLGGTDLDERKFKMALQDAISNLPVETLPAEHEEGKWRYVIKTEDTDRVIWNSEEADQLFDSEEEADEAGGQADINVDQLDDDIIDEIEEPVLSELADEYHQYAGSEDVTASLDSLSSEYYKFNDALLADLENYFQTEFPDTLQAKLLAALRGGVETVKKAGQAVADKVRQAGQGVRKLGQRVGRAAGAAAQAFRQESAKRVVADLLKE